MKTINFKPEPWYQTRHGPVPVHGPGTAELPYIYITLAIANTLAYGT